MRGLKIGGVKYRGFNERKMEWNESARASKMDIIAPIVDDLLLL